MYVRGVCATVALDVQKIESSMSTKESRDEFDECVMKLVGGQPLPSGIDEARFIGYLNQNRFVKDRAMADFVGTPGARRVDFLVLFLSDLHFMSMWKTICQTSNAVLAQLESWTPLQFAE